MDDLLVIPYEYQRDTRNTTNLETEQHGSQRHMISNRTAWITETHDQQQNSMDHRDT
jgi:hypothetical protein